MTPEQMLAEVEDILRTMPPRPTIRHELDENFAWLGRAGAFVASWDSANATRFQFCIERLHGQDVPDSTSAFREMLTMLHQAQNDLRMKTAGPLSIAVGQGMVFAYFDEIRKTLETARQDAFFVDPYLDADFVARYLGHVAKGVQIRLLAREKLVSLLPAVELFAQQNQAQITVRSTPGFHDRYIFIDRASCYQSGASFKDGGRIAPTTLTQVAAIA
jgi:hypothetical protein